MTSTKASVDMVATAKAPASKILAVVSEVYPLVKTGGLADVAGALPRALRKLGAEVVTLVPGYPAVKAAVGEAQEVLAFDDLLPKRVSARERERVDDGVHDHERPCGPPPPVNRAAHHAERKFSMD